VRLELVTAHGKVKQEEEQRRMAELANMEALATAEEQAAATSREVQRLRGVLAEVLRVGESMDVGAHRSLSKQSTTASSLHETPATSAGTVAAVADGVVSTERDGRSLAAEQESARESAAAETAADERQAGAEPVSMESILDRVALNARVMGESSDASLATVVLANRRFADFDEVRFPLLLHTTSHSCVKLYWSICASACRHRV
jgi:hypothetical protein